MHYRSILVSAIAALLSFTATVAHAVFSFFADWPALIDAKTSLMVDRARRRTVAVLAPGRSMFRAFRERALIHDHFTSDHFDPGRMAA